MDKVWLQQNNWSINQFSCNLWTVQGSHTTKTEMGDKPDSHLASSAVCYRPKNNKNTKFKYGCFKIELPVSVSMFHSKKCFDSSVLTVSSTCMYQEETFTVKKGYLPRVKE